ncbi:uncharacterized protein E0L32_006469 [Thyridium curvatum]|uniref:Major facilitator superfamily (MFS) profile domain-containing protein n=1 Tax=Thyridium curvatum TaxID=1093900 RepID=A0A507AZH2_9PEZI|nr:uncharacterized protein E0L32_006469 [Thyridium curvatum]TPX13043.1 hypothetical protein E0L32_006469 [Thyridium curvatum]
MQPDEQATGLHHKGQPPVADADAVAKPESSAVPSEASTVTESLMDSPPPNGGRLAWLQVAASFACYWNTLGVLNMYGAFQAFYERDLLRNRSPSDISWIGSTQNFCLMAVGVLIGPLFDAGYFRSLLVIGAFLVTFGFMMTSLCTTYWQVMLAQGICLGLGTCCLTIPSIALVPMWFTGHRRTWSMATATIGSCLGATVNPLLFAALQPRIGFPWTVRVMGFISLALCSFAIAVARPRYKTRPIAQRTSARPSFRTIIHNAALGERTYLLYSASIFFNNVGYFEPSYYIQSYAIDHGLGGYAVVGYLLTILNGASIFGRLGPSFAARKFGVLPTFIAIVLFSAVSVLYWISAKGSLPGNIVFAIVWGFFSGGVVAYAPVVLTTITADMSSLGTRLGVLSILKGVGSLVGPPIAGAIRTGTASYLGVQLFTGCVIMGSAILALLLHVEISRTGQAGKKR